MDPPAGAEKRGSRWEQSRVEKGVYGEYKGGNVGWTLRELGVGLLGVDEAKVRCLYIQWLSATPGQCKPCLIRPRLVSRCSQPVAMCQHLPISDPRPSHTPHFPANSASIRLSSYRNKCPPTPLATLALDRSRRLRPTHSIQTYPTRFRETRPAHPPYTMPAQSASCGVRAAAYYLR